MRAKIAVVAFTIVTALGARARADVTRQQCVDAYDRAQVLKKESKLREARETLLVCSNNACPAATRNDCVPWLAEVEAALPTASFAVRDADGKDVVGARIVIDGAFDKDASDGRAVPLDPGRHVVRVEASEGRTIEETVVLSASEKNRLVTISLTRPKPFVPLPPPHEPEPEPRSLVLPIVLGGIGVAGIGAAFFFGFSAKSDAEDLRKSCAPSCKDSDLDTVHTKLLASDIGLGIGVVALAAAAYLLLSPPASVSPGAKGVAIRF